MRSYSFFLMLCVMCFTSIGSNLNAITSVKSDSVSEKLADFPNKKTQKGKNKPVKLREVHVELMDGQLVVGNFLKIENGNLYLVNKDVKEIILGNNNEELMVIPLTNVDIIKKSPKVFIVGIVILVALMFLSFMFFGVSNIDGGSNVSASRRSRNQGIFALILGGIAGISTLFSLFPKKFRVKGDPSNYKPRKVKRFQPYEDLRANP